MEVGLRPAHVRTGQTAVLTVRVTTAGYAPESVDLEDSNALELVGYEDAYSTQLGTGGKRQLVLERRFELRALASGSVAVTPLVVSAEGTPVSVDPVFLAVDDAPLAWGAPTPRRPRGGDPREGILPEGVPPASSPDTREVLPGGVRQPAYPHPGASPPVGPGPYGAGPGGYAGPLTPPPGSGLPRGGAHGAHTGPGGNLPPGAWAPTADSDPWWPEIIPELARHHSVVDDPSGFARLGAGVTPVPVFVGQQVTHVGTAYFWAGSAHRLAGARYLPPWAEGMRAVDLPELTHAPAALGGDVAESTTFRRAFFPTAPGVYELSPAMLLFTIGPGTVTRQPMDTLLSEPLAVEVLPIPTGDAPPDWTGAVGRLSIDAWLTQAVVMEGQPVALVVRIRGVGNMETVPPPVLEPIYGSEVAYIGDAVLTEARDGVVGGVKTFTYRITPWEPGLIPVGPIVYSYFDPYVGHFGRVATGELLLEVGPFIPRN